MSISKDLSFQAKQLGERLVHFINSSPSPFHVVDTCIKLLEERGFKRLSERQTWSQCHEKNGKYFFTRNNSSLVAFLYGGKYEPSNGFKIVGAHTDSPNLQVKPNSAVNRVGLQQVSVATYGGGLWHTWFDRDLKLAGRVIVQDSSKKLISQLVHINRPILRVPSLCIHLQSADERSAFKVNKEEHICPILCSNVLATLNSPASTSTDMSKDAGSMSARHHITLLNLLAEELKCKVDDLVDFELSISDSQPAQLGGVFDEFVFAPRIDNLASCFCAIEAFLSSEGLEDDPQCRVICFYDHEEVGSESMAGAASTLLDSILQEQSDNKTVCRNSFLLSADMAHCVHPCYSGKHHELHRPEMHKGVVIKTNENKRYATDSISRALMIKLARDSGIPLQHFSVGNETPCGSTIGPIVSTRTGIRTVDLGCAQLSMHSIRETCGTIDMFYYKKLFKEFFQHFHKLTVDNDE